VTTTRGGHEFLNGFDGGPTKLNRAGVWNRKEKRREAGKIPEEEIQAQ